MRGATGNLRSSPPLGAKQQSISKFPRSMGSHNLAANPSPLVSRHHASNFAVETRSRTRVSQVPGKPPRGLDPRDGTELREHSSCLWVQITGVEANSFLPDEQRDRCAFACRSQPRPFAPCSYSHLRSVKLLERAGLGGGNCRGSLEPIFQIVIVILI